MSKSSPDIKADIKRFFQLLDTKEQSDSGTVFNPIRISCCRIMMQIEMEAILKRMKEYSEVPTHTI